MKYCSTRGQVSPVSFLDAAMMGLADDGGLLIPESIPDVRGRLADWAKLDYVHLATEILRLFIDDMPAGDLEELVARSYRPGLFAPEVAPTVKVGNIFVQELWHGPTLAFKDIALQFLGNVFEYVLARRGGRLNILGATSGDTGSAAIYGVRGRRGINIFMMHPHGRVSAIQERQMTSVTDANVHNIAVTGSFDDCQSIMKQLAGDLEFKRAYSLGAVNSVNWARVLAQIVYYFKAVFDVQRLSQNSSPSGRGRPEGPGEGDAPRAGKALTLPSPEGRGVAVAVPTGNFGDILAGWYAMKMGLPISKLILATNENNILATFFNTGLYRRGQAVQTLSPSMDIQVASNFERYLYYRLGSDPAELRAMMAHFGRHGQLRVALDSDGKVDADFAAGSAGREKVLEVVGRYWREHNYLLDPHTAVGVAVAEEAVLGTPISVLAPAGGEEKTAPIRRLAFPGNNAATTAREPVVCLATAHPAKFPEAVQLATGRDIARHPSIDALADLPTRKTVLPNSPDAVREFIVRTLG